MTDTAKRNADLRRLLNSRRTEMQTDVQGRIRDGRTDRPMEGRDDLEHVEADSQGDLALSLLQMKEETLTRIDAALLRLDAGRYGSCFECGHDIAERRLRALLFAVRCQKCEERREQAQGDERRLTPRRVSLSAFSDMLRS